MRKALAEASVVKKKEWFKRIDHGEKLGQIIFKYFDEIENSVLKRSLQRMLDWVDQ